MIALRYKNNPNGSSFDIAGITNGNMWQYCDRKFENGPHGFDYACKIVSAWTVHQFQNEYNPVHKHSNCKVSAVYEKHKQIGRAHV